MVKGGNGHHEDGNGRRGHSVDSGGLAQGGWSDSVKLFPDFIRQAVGVVIGKAFGDFDFFKVPEFLDFVVLALDIPFVFNFDFHLLNCPGMKLFRWRNNLF